MKSIRARAPKATSATVRKKMQAVGRTDTSAELLVRQALHAARLRYRKHVRPERDLRCTADVVFPRARLCVFVDGCFWHGCPEHYRVPDVNREWWAEKIAATVARDARQQAELESRGWVVIRVWEHEAQSADMLQGVVEKVRGLLSNSPA